jgi:hypothetical protein
MALSSVECRGANVPGCVTLKVLEIVVAHDSRGGPKTSTTTITLKAFKGKRRRA